MVLLKDPGVGPPPGGGPCLPVDPGGRGPQPIILTLLSNPLVVAALLMVFEGVSFLPLAKPFFLSLLVIVSIFAIFRPIIGTWVLLTLLVLQSPVPAFQGTEVNFRDFDMELGGNWFTIKVMGMAVVHWLIVFLLAINYKSLYRKVTELRNGLFLSYQFTFGVCAITAIGLATGFVFHFNWYRYFAEIQVVLYLLIAFLLPSTEQPFQGFAKRWLLYSMPVGGALYIMGTVLLADAIPFFSTRFDVIDYYVIVGLFASFLVTPRTSNSPSADKRIIMAVLLFYVGITLRQWGSTIYVALAIELFVLIRSRPNISLASARSTARSAFVVTTCVATIMGLSYYWVVVREDPWASMKVSQILDIYKKANSPDDMPQSTKVRIIEFQNIAYEGLANPIKGILGGGFGGYFTDYEYEFQNLNPTDFSRDQIDSHKYYGPHNNPNWLLLKFGALGLIGFIWFVLRLWKYSLASMFDPGQRVLAFLAGLGLVFMFGYGPKNSIILGMFLAVALVKIKPRKECGHAVIRTGGEAR